MVVFQKNYQQMSDVVSLASDCGVTDVYFNRLNPLSIDQSLFDEALYQSDDFIEVFKTATMLAQEKSVSLLYPKSMRGQDASLCKYPWNNIYVTWDGYMAPCCAKPFPKELNFGNVFEKDFLTCLNSDEFSRFRQSLKNKITPEFCRGCC
jgi:radical SAM protein with 4Fe4S-binding SPASM domain